MNSFKHVIVIGYGVVSGRVLSYVNDCYNKYGYDITYIEHEIHLFNNTKKYAKTNGINCMVIEDGISLTKYLEKSARCEKVLIISASNNFLFPKRIVDNKNIRIINFHNALLPDLPGRNAPSWAIYEKYLKTGITWHYVDSGIDEGDIIIQKECSLNDDTRAYELVAIQMRLAGDAFEEIFEDVLNDAVKSKKQIIPEKRRIYRSKEVPGGGAFSIEDDADDIYRLLRSMDYGKNSIFPPPKTVYNEQMIEIKRYKKIDVSENREADDKIFLPLGEDKLLMLKYEITKHGKGQEAERM